MDERMKRNALIVGALVLALLSIGAGALIALSSDNDRAESPSSTPSSTTTPSATETPSGSPEPSETETPEPSESESPILEDGHHFVFVKRALYPPDGSPRVRFDLAYFLTGTQGEQAAADHGEEFVDGYYIVNDNPRLRTLPLADDVEVEYIPATQCCELQPGDVDAWLESINGTNQTDYGGKDVPWWLTVEGGEITRIEQQYLP
jgi:hypothetical protein